MGYQKKTQHTCLLRLFTDGSEEPTVILQVFVEDLAHMCGTVDYRMLLTSHILKDFFLKKKLAFNNRNLY